MAEGSRLLVGGPERRRAYLKFAVSCSPARRPSGSRSSCVRRGGHTGCSALRAVQRPWSERALTRWSAPRLGWTLRRHTVQGRARMTLTARPPERDLHVRAHVPHRAHAGPRIRPSLGGDERRPGCYQRRRGRTGSRRRCGAAAGRHRPKPLPPRPAAAGPSMRPHAPLGQRCSRTPRPPSTCGMAGEIRPDNAYGAILDRCPLGNSSPFSARLSKVPVPRCTVSGNFVGSTDEIIQWAAWKWGVDEDVIRSVAVTELGLAPGRRGQRRRHLRAGRQVKDRCWREAATAGRERSLGRTRRRPTRPPRPGVPARAYQGRETWLGGGYRAGTAGGASGSGSRATGTTREPRNQIARVKQSVAARPWEQPGF